MALIHCPECGKEISSAAASCPGCGHPVAGRARPPAAIPVRTWNPGIAAVLSLVIPGAGQLYKGQILAAIGWFAVVSVGYWMLVVPGLLLHLFCILHAYNANP